MTKKKPPKTPVPKKAAKAKAKAKVKVKKPLKEEASKPADAPKGTNIWNNGSMLLKEEPYNRDEVILWPPPEKKEGAESVAEPVAAVEAVPVVEADASLPEALPYGMSPRGKPDPVRYHLGDVRRSRTCKFSLMKQDEDDQTIPVEGYFTVGLYDDGTPGEVFIEMGKQGHEMNGFANCWAIAISMLLQYGVHPKKLYDKFKVREFFPKGITSLTGVPIAKSIPDLVVRWMEYNLPPTKVEAAAPSDEEWNRFVKTVGAQVAEVETK